MELRHLRYFTAVVQWKGYREASRRIHVAQPAISQTVADLEEELGLKLFTRAKRIAQLTPEGEVFHAEAVRTLAQAELAIETARRASRGEIGRLSIGFLGSATSAFLPELVRKFKATYPGVKLTCKSSLRFTGTLRSRKGKSTSDSLGHSPKNRTGPSHRGFCTVIRCWLCCRVHDP
jgi:DNA-binding transcriptional LysR family regulator